MSESKTKKHRRQTRNWNRMQQRRKKRYEMKLAKRAAVEYLKAKEGKT